jgi:hypothetical protein
MIQSRRPGAALALLILASGLLFTSACAGYRLGNIPYKQLEGVRTIYVPVVKNDTYEPGLQVMTTNAVIRALNNDGTYQTSRIANADATLEVKIVKFERQPVRLSRDNVRTTDQYRIRLVAQATLVNHRTGTKVFTDLRATGETDFFVQQDIQEAERQAIPIAADKLARLLVNQITEGW